ncbi:DNA adenine methylase [Brachyspira aalborgi]|uniref:DNA adenine methylase n=2 Tax=Brachyspira aalborgi TaxID=29522 RepID=UPI0011C8C631|nr:DNA adenine methylase [Brachyspira aalborgi]TXJ14770.1 DNA adenine methylase [Brachyspira aalborgi]TXJ18595.1 DNA adenine methylase [Brachyspira aalborgi]TXJ48530.1 DNA adenine methylase [Brachyspira aalborgi]
MTISKMLVSNIKPFVKWAGGKNGLINSLISFIPKNFNSYFEPFVGGGALFFYLKNLNILNSKKIYLNDKNAELINSYKQIKINPNKLLEKLEILKNNHSKEYFYKIRNLDRDFDFYSLSEVFRAARFIYLNKTCFNGLCRYNAKGNFNTPMGSYKNPKIYDKDLIFSVHEVLKNVSITNKDFEVVSLKAKKGDFVYFDPPYYPLNKTSSFVSYTDNFSANEQIRLYKLFKMLDCEGIKVLQSNSNTDFIKELYKDFEIIEVISKRAINCKGDKRGKIMELIIRGNYE